MRKSCHERLFRSAELHSAVPATPSRQILKVPNPLPPACGVEFCGRAAVPETLNLTAALR